MKIRVNWGGGIALVYGTFVIATLSFVTFAFSRPVELVSADYYSRSLAHDQRIDAARGGDAFAREVSAVLAGDPLAVIVTLPRAHAADADGTLTFYRPSSAGSDVVVPIALDAAGVQRVDAGRLASGRWILKMEWTSGGARYYREQGLRLP
jgi:nitrogen fixation protein FixH